MIDDPNEATRNRPATPPNTATPKEPAERTTRDEPMTGTQAACLKTLCAENGERFDPDLTRAAAAELIDTLKARTPRPAGAGDSPDMS